MGLVADVRDARCIARTEVVIHTQRPLLGVGILPVGAVGGAEVVRAVAGGAAAAAGSCIDRGPLVADSVGRRVIGVLELLGLRLNSSSE